MLPATENADAHDLIYDTAIDRNETLSENVKQLLRVGHNWDDLIEKGWIAWNHSTQTWMIEARSVNVEANEAAMNALLEAYEVDLRIKYEDESLTGQIPKVAKEVGDDVRSGVAGVFDTSKTIFTGLVVLAGAFIVMKVMK